MLSHLSNAAYAEEPIREAPVFEKTEKACAPAAAVGPPEERVDADTGKTESEHLIAQLDELLKEEKVSSGGVEAFAEEEEVVEVEPVVWQLPKELHDFFTKLAIKAKAA